MRSLLGAALVFAVVASTEGAPRHGTFRVHLEANSRDGLVFAQPIRSITGKNVFIERMAWLSERDVKAFYPYRAADGSYGALLKLDDHCRTALDTLSVEHRGAYLYVFLNGRPLTELQIDRRVSDGTIYLASGLAAADIQLMNKDWKLIRAKKKK
ncbi:MAG TPA: hypothetical protein VH207_10205 [Chthoniobacterales bacterium]|jgi:hypothetical protein|nr:hypothetical protein [Chthoniobacterales bacterium]